MVSMMGQGLSSQAAASGEHVPCMAFKPCTLLLHLDVKPLGNLCAVCAASV